ncbi:hypothetical protein EJB05_15067 [Eragrostis curvula]|uniref:CASP-like protein n=1 Tax=Eragrostis curvula TaxID=38414 RepID=A0A5J9VZA6_9POAL|nr:hypothetical protein EJB05_15067 [Eragrostis curvula]
MKDVVGSPGTWCSLALRVSQFLCAGACFGAMATVDSSATNKFNGFRYLVVSMLVQFFWSFGLACVDAYALKTGTDFHTRGFVVPSTIVDWIMGVHTFGVASASAGLAVFFERDTELCTLTPMHSVCSNFKVAVILVFVTWSFIAASATSMFWLFASLD